MGKIIRNGIKYSATTEAALNINYNNTDSKMTASTVQGAIDELSKRVVNITQAEYDALGDYKYTNNVLYHITDAEDGGQGGGDFSGAAADVSYDNAESELEATNVQDALDILSGRLVKLTQEEYDALTEEEKQDNVYFVVDGEISGGNGIGGSGDTIVVGGEWKLLGSVTGTTAITLPSSFEELYIEITRTSNHFVMSIPKSELSEDSKMYVTGGGNYTVRVNATNNTVTLKDVYYVENGAATNFTSESVVDVYYKEASTHILNPNEDGVELLATVNNNYANAAFNAIALSNSLESYKELLIMCKQSSTSTDTYACRFTIDAIESTAIAESFYSTIGCVVQKKDNTTINLRALSSGGVHIVAIYGVKDNGGVTISKKDVYSTEEREVGTDVDGSPIYEKTYYSDSCNITAITTIDDTINTSNILRVVEMKENYYLTNRWEARSDAFVDNVRYCAYCVVASAGVRVVSNNQPVRKYHITIRYVKA